MSEATTRLSTLVALPDAARRPPAADANTAVEVLNSTDLLPSSVRKRLPHARGLVVDNALAFPFEAFTDDDWDVPLAVRFDAGLDPDDWLSVLGADVLPHLTPFDVAACSPELWGRMCRRHRLNPDGRVGDHTLSVEQILNRSRTAWRQLEQASYSTPVKPGAPIAVTAATPAPYPPGGRLRAVKARYRYERDQLRATLENLLELQPRTRDARAAIVAHDPHLWVSGFAPQIRRLTGVQLAVIENGPIGPEQPALDRLLRVAGSLRLELAPGSLDLVAVVADLASNPTHILIRLFEELVRSVRPAGWLVVLTEVVPDAQRRDDSGHWCGPDDLVELISSASGRTVNMFDAKALRRPGEDHHRSVLLVFQCLSIRHGA